MDDLNDWTQLKTIKITTDWVLGKSYCRSKQIRRANTSRSVLIQGRGQFPMGYPAESTGAARLKRARFLMPLPGFLLAASKNNEAKGAEGRAALSLQDSLSQSCQHFHSFTRVRTSDGDYIILTTFLTFKKKKSKLVKTKTAAMCAWGCERRNKNKQICCLAYPTSSLSQREP